MEIILKKDVKGLGQSNEVVRVAPGYGNNYLIPQGFGVVANQVNKKVAAENMRQAAHRLETLRAEAEAKAAKIDQLVLKLKAKVSDSGKIFGAVTALQLANLLKEHDVEVDRKDIGFVSPVKELGNYEATIVLHKGIIHTFQFEVVAE